MPQLHRKHDRRTDKPTTENHEFDALFDEALGQMPAKSAGLIRQSLAATRGKAEKLVQQNAQKFNAIFDDFLVGVNPEVRKKCYRIIHSASLAAAIVGFTPIPFADAMLLVPVQMAMVTRLYKLFGKTASQALTASVTRELVVVGLGRSLVGNVLKLLPAVGTVTGGLINASVASTITETLGWVTVKALNDGQDLFDDLLTFRGQFTRLLTSLNKAGKSKK